MRHQPRKLNKALIFAGAILTKDALGDQKQRDEALTKLSADLSDAVGLLAKSKADYQEQARAIENLTKSVEKKADGELVNKVEKTAVELSNALAMIQACTQAVESIKKDMDQPLYNGGEDLKDSDRKAAIELQRRVHLQKDGDEATFKADMDNLVDPTNYRSAVRKLMKAGLETKGSIVNSFSPDERKAFEAASLDSGFFSPELLGITVDCEIECASLLDLYDSVNVGRSTFMFPHVTSYGDIGKYDCDAKCDAEFGPEGNISWKNGRTYDYRGVFCFQRDVLREANYDFMGFMMRAVARSYRINRNNAMITGDGVNAPMGWLTADCFTKVASPTPNPTHQDLRQFLASAPVEYGKVTSVMHQNTFAYFASMVDNTGRFIFGDNLMGFGPSSVVDSIRISNCLPDPTLGGTRGSDAAPFVAGSFIMAAGVWDKAVTAVNHRPMFMEQFVGGSSAWCVKYQFGAKDGGFVTCCPAARTFQAGA